MSEQSKKSSIVGQISVIIKNRYKNKCENKTSANLTTRVPALIYNNADQIPVNFSILNELKTNCDNFQHKFSDFIQKRVKYGFTCFNKSMSPVHNLM